MGQFTVPLSFSISIFHPMYLFFELLSRIKSRCFLSLPKELPLDIFVFCFVYVPTTPFPITGALRDHCLPYCPCCCGLYSVLAQASSPLL